LQQARGRDAPVSGFQVTASAASRLFAPSPGLPLSTTPRARRDAGCGEQNVSPSAFSSLLVLVPSVSRNDGEWRWHLCGYVTVPIQFSENST